MRLVRQLSAVLTVAMALAFVERCDAAVVTWTLHNVVFTDGGMATGYFTVDVTDPLADAFIISSFDIKTTDRNGLGGFEYDSATIKGGVATVGVTFLGPGKGQIGFFNAGGIPKGWGLRLKFAKDPLVPGDGTIALLTDCSALGCSMEQGGVSPRFVTSGTMTTSVPEPSTLAFLGPAVGLLALLRRRTVSRSLRFRQDADSDAVVTPRRAQDRLCTPTARWEPSTRWSSAPKRTTGKRPTLAQLHGHAI